MADLEKVKNASYSYYEELIRKRDALKKEAFQMEREYVRRYGELILKAFEKKLSCIRKKKTITFIQSAINHGLRYDALQLEEYLKKEMADFEKRFREMQEDYERALEGKGITQTMLLRIRKLYYNLAKKMHPDMNPNTEKSEELMDLWNRIQVAYNCNDLKELEELAVLVESALEKTANGEWNLEIPDVDEKIEKIKSEIEKIRSTDPYQFGTFLNDPILSDEKKKELEEDVLKYEEYEMELDETLSNLMKGANRICRTS